MQTLKRMISRYMQSISWIVVVITLIISVVLQILNEQQWACESAERTFYQMEQVLEENQRELEDLEANYRKTCLINAEGIAYIIEGNPKVLESIEDMKRIAEFMEVAEIHIFDKTGRIFTGTHPEYYGLSVDSGEQIGFFKPMLEDKSLKLVQDITPNTAEAKQMQYSAVWSESGEFIVQVGMEPVSVMKVTEKNELSYIFSLFRANAEANYYAIHWENGEIVGSTDLETVGMHPEEIGLDMQRLQNNKNGFHAKINGRWCFCVFRRVGSNYIGRVVSADSLYHRIPGNAIVLALCLVLITMILAGAVTDYMNRYVVDGIHNVNEKLRIIGKGELEERVDVKTSVEFAELSEHINEMVKSILDNNRKMSYILSKTNMAIAVYEYNELSRKVRFTEYFSKIFNLDKTKTEALSSNYVNLRRFLENIQQNPVQGEAGVFRLEGEDVRYVRLEEVVENNQVFGVAIDVTEEISKLKKVEVERDIDLLTGLYNRRGMERKLDELFQNPDLLGNSAFIMVDADGLKGINDQYGHDKGDVYLKRIAEVINQFDSKGSLAARQGGDEFVLFLYQYNDENELMDVIKRLEYEQNHSMVSLGDHISVALHFSMGYCMGIQNADYQEQLKIADERMYENKRQRKQQYCQGE